MIESEAKKKTFASAREHYLTGLFMRMRAFFSMRMRLFLFAPFLFAPIISDHISPSSASARGAL
jgi:hypothetical protein